MLTYAKSSVVDEAATMIETFRSALLERDREIASLRAALTAAPASAAEPVGCLAQAYDWYRENYCMEPHKETRHGGDQVANAYALGMLHAQQGTRPSIEQQVESLQAQAKWAPKGSIT